MIMQTFEWFLLKCFDMCWETQWLMMKMLRHEPLPFYKTHGWVRMWYHSNFTVQPHYSNWVGINWKCICLSRFPRGRGLRWGYLVMIVHLCSSQNDRWSWLGGQTHRIGAYTRACNWKLGLIICILSMVNSGLFLTDVSNIVVKVYHLRRVSNYSNSRVRGYGQLEWPYCSIVRCFQNDLWNDSWLDLTIKGLWYEIQVPT